MIYRWVNQIGKQPTEITLVLLKGGACGHINDVKEAGIMIGLS